MSNNSVTATLQNLELITPGDLFSNTPKGTLHIGFYKSSSKNFDLVMSMIEGRSFVGKLNLNKKDMYVAAFNINNAVEAGIAYSVLDLTSGWKGLLVAYEGRTLYFPSEIRDTLSCIITANRCTNHLAHCLVSTNMGIYSRNAQEYIIPCKKLSYYFRTFDSKLPISEEDQLQAKAVDRCVDWCPYFDMANFKRL